VSLALTERDVKYIVNRQGKPCAVQMSYRKFMAMKKELDRLNWFESPEVQEDLRKADQDIIEGKVIRVSEKNIDEAISWLDGTN
jgi:hypothetical protein